MFPDPVRPVQSQEAHMLDSWTLEDMPGEEREMSCWLSPGNEIRDVTWRRWLVQAKSRERIMTRRFLLRQEAEDLLEYTA